jgi:hypothetical protein
VAKYVQDFELILYAAVPAQLTMSISNTFPIDLSTVSTRDQSSTSEEHEVEGEKLVRIPIEELQTTERAA